MTFIGIIFCLAIVLLAGTGVVSPPAFLTIVRRLTSLQGFYLLAILRIATVKVQDRGLWMSQRTLETCSLEVTTTALWHGCRTIAD